MSDPDTFFSQPYPWQARQWQQLMAMLEGGTLAHALLLAGGAGTGKLDFAHALSNRLLCDTPGGDLACGQCKSCQLQKAGSHPDFKVLSPEDNSKVVKVDQIRALVDFINKKAQYSGYKVVIVSPAEAMNISASNALLKSLEEPGAKTVLLLLSHSPSRLMATIRSRCQKLTFPLPKENEALNWLSEQGVSAAQSLLSVAGGAPLKARDLDGSDVLEQRKEMAAALLSIRQGVLDPVVVASQWEKGLANESLKWLIAWTLDWVRVKLDQPVVNQDLQAVLSEIATSLNTASIFTFCDALKEAREQVQSSSNPNINLMWDHLLIKWAQLH